MNAQSDSRVRRRPRNTPRTPAALWQRWARSARPPFLAWGLLPLLWLLWAWAASTGHLAAWFVGAWAFPFHFWWVQAAWYLWARPAPAAARRSLAVLPVLAGTLGAGVAVGALAGDIFPDAWAYAIPWSLPLLWGTTGLAVLLLPWWWEVLPLLGVLSTWAVLGPIWLAGLYWGRGWWIPGGAALLHGLAGCLGAWGVFMLALAWVRVPAHAPARKALAVLFLLAGLVAAAGGLALSEPGVHPAVSVPQVVASPTATVIPPTPTPARPRVEVLPGPPTATRTPTATWTPSPIPSPTPVPSATPTATVPTPTPPPPSPTPMLAFVQAPQPYGGAFLRKAPNPDAPAIVSLLNGTRVWVLEPERVVDGLRWAHVRTLDGEYEGWILQSLLVTATPPPRW